MGEASQDPWRPREPQKEEPSSDEARARPPEPKGDEYQPDVDPSPGRAASEATRAYVGLSVCALDPGHWLASRLPNAIAVQRVARGGPAQRAGIRPGDVIVGFNGKPVSMYQFAQNMARAHVGSTVNLRVVRDSGQGQRWLVLDIKVKLARHSEVGP
ncbi:MAG: PDZ domain-containing protein [Candidatus Brocadiia bacterium]